MFFNRVSVLSTVLAASVVAPALSAQTTTGGIMFVTRANSKGTTNITGSGGSHFIEVKHSMVSPRDPQSGLPTGKRPAESGLSSGKRQWKPITIVKEIDSASPKLWQALKENEVLQVKLEFNPNGKSPKTIDFEGATIANLRKVRQGTREVEEIEFRYERIEVTHRDGRKSNADDWAP